MKDVLIVRLLKLKLIPLIYTFYMISLLTTGGGMETFSWVVFILVLAVSIHDYFKYGQHILVSSPLNKYVFILALILILSVLLSPYIGEARRGGAFYYIGKLRNWLLFYSNLIVLTRFVDYKKIIKLFSLIIGPIVVLYIFMSLSGLSIKPPYKIDWVWDFSRGINGFLSMYIEYSIIFGTYFFVLLGMLLWSRLPSVKYRVWLSLSLIVVLFSLMASGSRAPYFAVPVGIFFMFLMNKKIRLLLVSTVLLVIIGLVSYNTNEHLKQKTSFTIENIDVLGDPYRYGLLLTNLEIFKAYPILGVGYHVSEDGGVSLKYVERTGLRETRPDAYRWLIRSEGRTPHNMFIHILTSAGVIGITAFMVLIVSLIRLLIKTRNYAYKKLDYYDLGLTLGVAGAWGAFFGHMMFDTPLLNVRTSHSFMLLLSLTAFLYNKHKRAVE